MRSLKRVFYKSVDGSCSDDDQEGQGDNGNGDPTQDEDSFILPFDACVGPFGPPLPWGKFTLLDQDFQLYEVEGGVSDSDVMLV